MYFFCMMMLISVGTDAQSYLDTIFWVKVENPQIQARCNDGPSTNANLNTIFSKYSVSYFDKALPFAKNPELQKIYEIHCQGQVDNFISELTNTFPSDLNKYSKFETPDTTKVYNPVDYMWQLTLSDTTKWLWHLYRTKCYAAWDVTHGDPNIKIGVLDQPVDITHPDLSSRVSPSYDPFTHIPYTCSSALDHGTAVASFAGAETTEVGGTSAGQLASAAFKSTIVFYNAWGITRQQFLQKALHASNVMGVRVIVTCAGGGLNCLPDPNSGEDLVTKEILDNGTVIVMPAGNGLAGTHCESGGVQHAFYPLNPEYDSRVIVVTGTGYDDKHYHEDASGNDITFSHFTAVDLCAPGWNLMGATTTACGNNTWPYGGWMHGTSFAAPITTSIVALVLSVNPCLGAGDVEDILKQTTDPVVDAANYPGLIGTGRINARNAVNLATTYGNLPDITSNTTWDTEKFVNNTITISSGNTLTITTRIRFSSNGKLVVAPGAKLIIDGGILTNSTGCGSFWPGIEVWGDYNQSQYTINGQCPQGILIIKNNSLIENAENIAIWRPGYYYTAGGIIQASNSTFKNNRRSTEFISYHNFNPYSPPPRPHLNNYSYFSHCSFEIDNSYVGPNPFYAHISMWDVEGISIKGCHFSNTKSYSTSIGRGYGIYTIDAGYIIDTYCNSPSTPCPPSSVIRSTFQGLFAGISALNGSSPNTVYINKADFTDNSYGIRLNAVNNATGVLNTFDIGSNTICPNFTGIGVEMNNCTGYTIEQNSFTHSGNTNQGDNYIGVRVIGQPDPSMVTYNQIYNNSSQGITIGNQAEKNNANSTGTTGLYYICNDNNNNIYDFYVFGPGIAQYQGSYSRPAGNKFSKNANNPYSDFNNQASWTITYKYYNGDPLQFPESIYNVITQGTPNQNLCPDNYGGNGIGIEKLSADQISALQLEYADNITAYNNIKAMYESLKDGGNTSALSSDINNSTPDQTMQLRDELLGRSPHLSREILVAAANKNDVLPDPILFEILAANPDELRNDSLLNYLKEKTNPLPDYMIELLKAIASDSTYKTTLQSGLSYYYAKSMNAAYALTHDILLDTVKDYSNLRNWLDNQHTISADYQIIDSWFAEKNTTSALALLDLLPQTYSLDSSAMVEYNYYKDFKAFQAGLINNNTNIYQLDSAQIAFLDYTASNSKGIAEDEARNILEFAYGVFNINCPPSPDSPVKSAPFNAAKNLNLIYEPKITVTPNPAGSWAVFNYTLLAGVNNSWIKITDMKNQVIKILPITKVEGQITWDTRDIPSGLYIYTLMNDKYSKSGKVSVVH